MPHLRNILFALVSLAVITCKATPWSFGVNDKPDNPYGRNNENSYGGGHWKPDVSKNNNNYNIQLLVFVDHGLYSVHKRDEVQVRNYVMSFWKGVALRFRALKIGISIAGVIIGETPYLTGNIVDRNFVNVYNALNDFGKYLYKKTNLPRYDVAVQMTTLDLCTMLNDKKTCIPDLEGVAYHGGACEVIHQSEEVHSVAIIKDSGGYRSIILAAHELGHLLGAPHDGEESETVPKGPGAKNCDKNGGYIMNTNTATTLNAFHWSSCSKENIFAFLKSPRAQCLHNDLHVNSFEGIPLPGKTMSLDEQCQKDMGTNAAIYDSLVCTKLCCWSKNIENWYIFIRPAAEGSPCGEGLHCISGECVSEISSSQSNYGQLNFQDYKEYFQSNSLY